MELHKVLDPRTAHADSDSVAVPILPAKVRNFGYVPDISKLLPGDLVLFSEVSPTLVGAAIERAQRRAGFSAEDARWTHAAVYLDGTQLVEATPERGVAQRSVYEDIPEHLMRFRRAPDLSEIDRYRIALRALSMLGRSYSVGMLVALSRSLWRGLWNRQPEPDMKGIVICSQVFYDAQAEISGRFWKDCPVNAPVTPAHLSHTVSLQDLDVQWKRLK